MRILPLVLAGAVALALPATVAAKNITVSHGYSPTHVISAQGIEPWMACVTDKSAGSIEFDYFPSGQIASIKDSLDALNNGLSSAAAIAVGYDSSRLPLNGVTMLPDMGDSAVEMSAAYHEALDDGLLAAEFTTNRLHPVFNIMLPVYQIVSAVGPLRTMEEFNGKVIRSGGGAMNLTLSSVGASPAEIPSADMYVAMQRGTVDATLSALSSIKPYNLQELMKAVSTNGKFGTFATVFAMDAATWEGLSPEEQAAVTNCGTAVEADLARYLDTSNAKLAKEFADAGIDMYEFTPQEWAPIGEKLAGVSAQFIDRLAKRGLPAQEAYDAYQANLGR